VFAHPVFGIIIFGLIMWGVFTISQMVVGPWISGLLETGMGYVAGWVETGLENLGVSTGLQAFILEGIIGGFSAIIGFLPLIMVLFFLLNLMEDSGYMTRVALLMDKYFKKIGLAGKSIIPMYVGTACSVPAIMSARTIKNKKQRRLTVLLTPFVPCGAKLPIIALFLGVILGNNRSSYTVLVYLFAIVIIFLTGLLIKALLGAKIEDQEDSYLLVELPEYKLPSLKSATIYMLNSAKTFIKKAGTIILVANALVWLMVSYDFSLTMVAPDASILASLSSPIAWLLTPIGITAWGLAAAAVLGFIAKEEVVGALAIIFVFSVTDDFAVESWSAVREALMTTAGLTTVSALAYMVFNLFTPPCFASIGAMNAELESRWWTVFAVALQLIVGFFSALIIYQFGTLIVTGSVGVAFVPAMILLGAFIAAIIILSNLAKQGKGLGVLD
ncbi:MAG: nucleoside recognition domain-containing protein, partial [Bacillota bacterium]